MILIGYLQNCILFKKYNNPGDLALQVFHFMGTEIDGQNVEKLP